MYKIEKLKRQLEVQNNDYKNFRFKTFEELLFVNTVLESAVEESHFGLEGKEFLISTIYDDRKETESSYILWVSSDEANIYFISVVRSLLLDDGVKPSDSEMSKALHEFINTCSINQYELPATVN